MTPPELLSVLRKIEAQAFYQANRLRESCSLVFRYAIATDNAERETAAALRGALKSHVTTSRAAITEPEEVGGLLRAIDTGHFITKCGLHSGTDLSSPKGSELGQMV